PRFSALVQAGDEESLRYLYHAGSQLLAAVILPTAAVLAMFPYEILLQWTGDVETAKQTAPIVRLLVVGTALNGLMNLPYALQLAHGWVGIGLRINIGLIVVMGPALVLVVPRFGAVGAAMVWLTLNAIAVAVAVPWT